MNEQISWDSTLVKKYSSSNHFKMLNQLRNEVKKYPLNKKKDLSSNIGKSNKLDSNNNIKTSIPQNELNSSNPFNYKDTVKNKLTVSFNNSKNFSIYNNTNNDTKKEPKDINSSDDMNSNEDYQSSSFKDRLDQIDMK